MPTATVSTPSGDVKVKYEKGDTDEEILAKAKHQEWLDYHATSEETLDDMAGPLTPFGIDTGIQMPRGVTEFLAGAGRRLDNIVKLGGQVPDDGAKAMLDQSLPATAGGIVGDIAGYGTLAAGAGMALPAAATTGGAGMALSALGGALYGGATAEEDRGSAAMLGAAGNVAGRAIPAILGAAAKPDISHTAKVLIKNGGTATPGEMFGGAVKRIEDAATTYPIIGDAIKGAQNRTLQSFDRVMINDAMNYVGKSLPKGLTGRAAIDAAQKTVGKAFDDSLRALDVTMDDAFKKTITDVIRRAKTLPKDERKVLLKVIKNDVIDNFAPGTVPGQKYQKIIERLKVRHERFDSAFNDGFKRELGDLIREVKDGLLDLGQRTDPIKGKALKSARVAYAKLARVEEAANMAGAKEGVFTPNQLLGRIRANTSRRKYASGKGFNQRFVEEAANTISPTVNDSGTATRAALGAVTAGGLQMVSPPALYGLLGVSSLYTRPGQMLTNAALAYRPNSAQMIRELLEKGINPGGVLGTSVGVNQ